MTTSTMQYKLRVNGRVTKPHIYWHQGFKKWTWNVSGRVYVDSSTVQLCNEFCNHLNLHSRPI